MKDRIPTYPGRVRLIPVDGQTNVFDLERADEPTEPGTPLCKANLLSDTTAAIYGLGEDATPDAAFANVPGIAGAVSNKGWYLLDSYTEAGAFTWTAPDLFDGADYKIGVYMIGGGGSGGASKEATTSGYKATAGGGASGFAKILYLTVSPGQEIPIVVGAGGAAVTCDIVYCALIAGLPGGSTAFNGITAAGGNGGNANIDQISSYVHGADGGQGGDAVYYGIYVRSYAPAMGQTTLSNFSSARPGACELSTALNPFNLKRYLGAGGGAGGMSTANPTYQTTPTLDDGNKAGAGLCYQGSTGMNITADSATGAGNGGGGACLLVSTSDTTHSATSGAGSAGAVYIYVQGANV